MLSVLIPIYNYDLTDLVNQLHRQLIQSTLEFEIICIDDGSNSSLNKKNQNINALTHSQFIALEKNLGLSSIRNKLAELSKYENLLFIDGDSKIISANYIVDYINSIKENTQIIYGGRVHPKHLNDSNRSLRWKYGKHIEDKTALVRSRDRYTTLMFNNTLILKECFNAIKFHPVLKKYGHEDTLFAYQVSLAKLKVNHIENPIEHNDIDINTIYLKKTILGLNNLRTIYKKGLINHNFIKLLLWHKRLDKFKADYILILFYNLFNKSMIYNLKSSNPSLFVFGLFKLSYFCKNFKQAAN